MLLFQYHLFIPIFLVSFFLVPVIRAEELGVNRNTPTAHNRSQTPSQSPWRKQVTVHWSGTPLRESLDKLADLYSFCFLLDRRIDPSISISFEATNEPLAQALPRLARENKLGCVLLSEIIYFGPEESATMLPNVLARQKRIVSRLPAKVGNTLRERTVIAASLPAEPKRMLENVAQHCGMTWANLDVVPYDLWDDTKLAGTNEEIVTLILFSFEKMFEWDTASKKLCVIPLPKMERKILPAATKETNNRSPSPPGVPLARRRFTLKVEEQRLDLLLVSLAERLELELLLDKVLLEKKGVALDRRVSFEVKNATASELFQAVLEPINLQFRLNEKVIEVE